MDVPITPRAAAGFKDGARPRVTWTPARSAVSLDSAMPDTSKPVDVLTRTWLAFAIVGAGIVGVVAISAVALAFADDKERASQLVFSAVLPLFGTWVGTVLAFYFARENLEAATQSTLALAGRDTAAPVTQVMIREADFVAYDLGTGDSVENVRLSALRDKMRQLTPPSRRLPVRDAGGAIICVIHDATLTAYAESQHQTTESIDRTLGDLLSDPEYKALVEAVGFVPERATIGDARQVMGSIKNCNDVFVTETGKREERAIGWLTNTLLAGVQ